jgi:DcmR-like sensory protein
MGLEQALHDGYAGLWASGDMAWEFGPRKDFTRLLEYEWRLEEFFQAHTQLCGICQYHADALPDDALRQGLTAHPSVFLNKTLTLINPYYIRPE